MDPGRWSDEGFLDSLRRQGDPLADQAVARLLGQNEVRTVNAIFKKLRADDDPLPADTPEPFREFLEATRDLPPGADYSRLARGGNVFLEYAAFAAVSMLASSLPRGYAAPCLCEILSISGELEKHPYQRLMGVVQLLVNVSSPGSFQTDGKAIITAQKLRLLHAGVRTMVPRFRPGYEEKYGMPVNHEDMLATIMGFSYLVIHGLRRLGLPLSDEEAEDYYYLWYIYAQMMGIREEYVPPTLSEAGEFYNSFVRRHDTGPEKNPYGVILAKANLAMMKSLIPRHLRLLGFGAAPAIAMAQLMTPEEMARVSVRPVTGHRPIRNLLHLVLYLTQGVKDLPFAARLAVLIFQDMINTSRGGQVTFTIPVTLAGLRDQAME
ncbi:MAG TPA: oxygenase MpaB family protein [Thermoanaerobaculia bacterium]